jgi:hypothetical protein
MSFRIRIKVGCLFAFAIILAGVMFAGRASTSRVYAYAEGPPAGFTGAPGEETCVVCHSSFALDSGTGTVTINTPNSYQPGQTYQITVQDQTTDQSRRRWGFQMTVLTGANAKAGQLQGTSLTNLLTNDGPGFSRDYIEHNLQGTFPGQRGGAMWTFPWIAPSTDVGPVTFYVATNMANGDGNLTGDFIFTQTKTIPASSASTSGPPVITSITIQGKRMFVTGSNFDDGATMFVNDQKTKTRNDDTNPTTMLICKKAGNLIDPGTTVNLQVKNSDGTVSDVFVYTRPST